MKVRLRREEQAEVIRAIESVRVYEEFIEDTMQNRAREATTRQNSTELEERRKKIMASIVISKYQLSGKGNDVWETIELGHKEKESAKEGKQDDKKEVNESGANNGDQNMFTNIFQFLSNQVHVAPTSENEDTSIKPKLRQPGLYSSDTCSICLDRYEKNDEICYSKRDCGHEFHLNCLMDWLMRNGDCPTCRSSFLVLG